MGQRFKSVSRQMRSYIKKFVLSDPKFLTYFLPKRLKAEDFISITTLSFNKKNLEFEVSGLNIIDLDQAVNFLGSLENRFYLYDNTPFFSQQEFSLSINKLDYLTKNILFEREPKKLDKKYGSLLSFISEKDKKLLSNNTFLIKCRLLNLTKGGFVSSCFNSLAYVNRSSFFFKFSKQRSYKSWFSLNLCYYGFLSYFLLVSSRRLLISQPSSQGIFSKRVKFYYLQNEGMKYFFLLAKPKNFLNNRFSKI